MNTKFTWGTAILVVIIFFILGIIGFFTFSSRQEYFLVEEDYYEKELKYQDQIDKMNNVKAMSEKVSFVYRTDTLHILFPGSFPLTSLEGVIHLYRPSDSRMDALFNLAPDESGKQSIDLKNLPSGKFIIKMDWKMGGKDYYQEQTLIIK